MNPAKRMIAVFGTSRVQPGDEVFCLAEEVGRAIAQAGFDLVNGGYGGVMLASACGAAQAGGRIVGVSCKAFKRSRVNEHITDEVPTEDLQQRLATLVDMGQAYVILPGGTGTLLELADVWEHKNKGFDGYDKPIILVGDFWKPLIAMIRQADPRAPQAVITANTVEEVIRHLKETLR